MAEAELDSPAAEVIKSEGANVVEPMTAAKLLEALEAAKESRSLDQVQVCYTRTDPTRSSSFPNSIQKSVYCIHF
jgi:hypothetical protein